MSKRKILYFDMDGVLVDFVSGINRLPEETVLEYQDHLDDVPGIFSLMEPMPGSIEAVKLLAKQYDVYILSTAPWNNPSAWADKVRFVQKYFPEVFHKRLILSHHKELCKGDYLIDDRSKHGAEDFKGEWIQFRSEMFPDWDAVINYLHIGRNFDQEEYDEELKKVTKAVVRKVNEDLSGKKPRVYPATWKAVDWLSYEWCLKGYHLDEICAGFNSLLDDIIESCCEGATVIKQEDVQQEFMDYLKSRSRLNKIQDYHWIHG